ncbi:DNA-(apurinic or apyrimidinic site) endonuclease [Pantherophis guttatus]|uniref:DNA repair nuclease/redox regulator APEX1 n=1 Tax=Pantherophis guttatus TaxID=94885 RepID=A0A6P9BC04_PANGU|nr:DNA-(apurinic or apyrimidinic site) endonuclease [Pantherophis guttatus]
MPKREKKNEEQILPTEEAAEPEPKKAMKDDEKQEKKEADSSILYQDPPDKLTSPSDKKYTLKVTSWNVDGIRAWFKKKGLEWVKEEDPDVLCLQETKCAERHLPADIQGLPEYPHKFWACSNDKEGYSGVAMLSKNKPTDVTYGIGDEEHDKEGRVITAEFPNYFLVTAYVPNAGRGLVRLEYRQRWDGAFRSYLEGLAARKPLILCGDLNVAHQEIDLKNPKGNKKSAGFTPEERAGFTQLLEAGFVDTFRHLYPDTPNAYTFWTYMMNARAKNVGWRLDYFVVSKGLLEGLCDSKIRSSVLGSDHCPITLYVAM